MIRDIARMGDLASVPNGYDSLKALVLSQKPYHKYIHRLGFYHSSVLLEVGLVYILLAPT